MNSLNRNLLDQVVVIKAEVFQAAFRALHWRVWRVTDGFGAMPMAQGRALHCRSVFDGQEGRFDGMAVERLATATDLAAVDAARVGR